MKAPQLQISFIFVVKVTNGMHKIKEALRK